MNESIRNEMRWAVREKLTEAGSEINALYKDKEIDRLISIFLQALIDADWTDDMVMQGNQVLDNFVQPDEPTTRTDITQAMLKAMLKSLLNEGD